MVHQGLPVTVAEQRARRAAILEWSVPLIWRLIYRHRRTVVVVSVLFGTFLLLLAMDETIYAFLHAHFNHATRPVPDLLKLPHRLLRCAEDWGENIFILCIAFAMWQFDRSRRSRIVVLFLAAALTAGVVEGIKRLSGRERPDIAQGRSVFHGPAEWSSGGEFQSFPSGHAAAGASFSGSLASFYPPIRPVVVALAVGCAGNRIWKERHFVSDCFVSLVLGFTIAGGLARRARVHPACRWFDQRFSEPAMDEGSPDASPVDSGGKYRPWFPHWGRRPLANRLRFH